MTAYPKTLSVHPQTLTFPMFIELWRCKRLKRRFIGRYPDYFNDTNEGDKIFFDEFTSNHIVLELHQEPVGFGLGLLS